MREETEWSPFEHKIAAALQSVRPQPTNACLEPDDLLMLAEQGEDAPDYGQRMAHVAACAFCRPEYVQMRADLLEVERMRAHISVPPAPMLQAGQTQTAQVTATLQKAQGEQPQATVATQRTPVAQRPSLWQRLLAPRVLAPAFAASTLLASISLKAVYSVQQENRTLARELTQERSQNIALAKQQKDREGVAVTKWGQGENVTAPSKHDGDHKTDPQGPPVPAIPDPSTVAKAQADRQLAEARERLQADQARNAQTAERLKQAQARLERKEQLLNAQLLAASRKQNKAAVVTSNGPHSAPPDTHQGQTPPKAAGTDVTVSLRNLIAMAAPPPEKNDLLTPEAGSTRSPSGEEAQSIELLSPQGSVILEPRPLLRWRPVDGAAYYKVYGSEVSRSPAGGLDYKKLAGMEATVRATGTRYRIEHALAPGKVYSWEVTAYRDMEEKPFARTSAKFLVADAAQANAIKRLADVQLAAAKSLEARQEWEQAKSQYRAISSSVPDVYDRAQARVAALEERRKRQP